MDIGDSIGKLRRNKNLTQEELAKITGFSRGYIAAIEGGRRTPSVKALVIIVEGLGVSIEELNKEE